MADADICSNRPAWPDGQPFGVVLEEEAFLQLLLGPQSTAIGRAADGAAAASMDRAQRSTSEAAALDRMRSPSTW